jgi:hypothetical protein
LTSTGLSATPLEYRDRLDAQSDEQIDAWAKELMRDMSIRVGVRTVLADLRKVTGASDDGLLRVYAAGGGPPSAAGYTEQRELMVPAISLHYFVTGMRSVMPDARERLVDYLVENFEEIIYI